jgi:lantibiotic biosynthesis protein
MVQLNTTYTIDPIIREALAKQVDRISEEISEKWPEVSNIGLLEGRSGMVILFAYLSKLFPGRGHEATTLYYLNNLRHALTTEELGYDLSSGVAGVGFVFQHLKNMAVVDSWVDLDLSELDEFLELGAEQDFKSGNWDPLVGLTGLGIYFLERNKDTGEKRTLEKIVDYLAGMRVVVGGREVWVTRDHGKYNKDNYNFGMAHGMPGVLSFLAQVHARDIKQLEIEEMIGSCLSFLLDHEYADDPVHSFPPALIVDHTGDSARQYGRLAWCYGDLCMANALIHCGKALSRVDWFEKGISVALKTTERNFDDSDCIDAAFCHGTVGLAHQYHRLHHLTHTVEFREARDYWLNITQKHFYKAGEGAGGYFSGCYNEETGEFEPELQYGLLEGSTGIALVYLSILYNISPDWDIIFLANV